MPEFAPIQDVLRRAAALPATPLFQSPARPTFAVYALPANPTITLITPTVTFDDAITLRGYELLPRQPGEPYQLLTYWQVEASALPWDLAIFVHLLGADGTIHRQMDWTRPRVPSIPKTASSNYTRSPCLTPFPLAPIPYNWASTSGAGVAGCQGDRVSQGHRLKAEERLRPRGGRAGVAAAFRPCQKQATARVASTAPHTLPVPQRLRLRVG